MVAPAAFRKYKYAISPPIPLSMVTEALDQLDSQMWETISVIPIGVGRTTSIFTPGKDQAEIAVCVVCRSHFINGEPPPPPAIKL